MQQDVDLAFVPMKSFLLVADVANGHTGNMGNPLHCHGFGSAGFAGNHHLVGCCKRFAGGPDRPRIDSGLRALAVEKIHNLVRDAITDLVGVSLRNGLARKQVGFACQPGPSSFWIYCGKSPGLSQALGAGSRPRQPKGRTPCGRRSLKRRPSGCFFRDGTLQLSYEFPFSLASERISSTIARRMRRLPTRAKALLSSRPSRLPKNSTV